MKTAGRENPNRRTTVSSTRVHGAAAQSRSRSIRWAGKQEKLRPQEECFFLTSPFIELLSARAAQPCIPHEAVAGPPAIYPAVHTPRLVKFFSSRRSLGYASTSLVQPVGRWNR